PGQDGVESETGVIEKFENRLLGADGEKNVYLKRGPYGPYVQLGEDNKTTKPKRIGLPKGMSENDIGLEKALALLQLPRTLGNHPGDGQVIKASIGPYGPYVTWNKKFYSLKSDDVLEIGLARALELIASYRDRKKPKQS
ncbi:MAG: hypothetical protein LBB24_03645, partial [Rickettsiales bacterium]|nr:hypothetical protein [Rickettsiales bacterium]